MKKILEFTFNPNMTNAQQNPLELAKQGNVNAIAFLINLSLQSKGITSKAFLKDNCLQIILEAVQTPNQQVLASFIHKGVTGLEIAHLNKLRVCGQQIGEESPSWSQDFDLQEQEQLASLAVDASLLQSPTSQENSLNLEITTSQNKIQQTNIDEKNHLILECKGENGILVLTETEIIIKRKGGFLSGYKKGEKHILYSDILDFQYQKSKLFSVGYIYIQLSGLAKEITKLEAHVNEHSVTFFNERVQDFDKVKDILVEKVNPHKYDINERVQDFDKVKDILVEKVNPHKYDIEANSDDNFGNFLNSDDSRISDEVVVEKVNPQKQDNVFEGISGTLILTETGITIKRSLSLFSGYPAGEKTIPYKSITAIQFKKVDITVGFIQFTIQGGVEAKGGAFEAVKDENTVTFRTEDKTKEFERAKKIIDQKIIESNSISNNLSDSIDDLEKLEKLASLKDKGIITEKEFQAKKKQILNL